MTSATYTKKIVYWRLTAPEGESMAIVERAWRQTRRKGTKARAESLHPETQP